MQKSLGGFDKNRDSSKVIRGYERAASEWWVVLAKRGIRRGASLLVDSHCCPAHACDFHSNIFFLRVSSSSCLYIPAKYIDDAASWGARQQAADDDSNDNDQAVKMPSSRKKNKKAPPPIAEEAEEVEEDDVVEERGRRHGRPCQSHGEHWHWTGDLALH